MGDADLCENWEQFSEDSERLEKELAKLTVGEKAKNCASGSEPNSVPAPTPQFRILRRSQDPPTAMGNPSPAFLPSSRIELDSTSEESLRTQFVPQLKILSRPKNSPVVAPPTSASKEKNVTTKKSFEQREKEYSEARMRILGDVRFVEEEKEAELESTMTPAEILKMKVARAVLGDAPPLAPPTLPPVAADPPPPGDPLLDEAGQTKGKSKRKPRPRATPSPLVPPPTHFPPSKMDSERILRQPKGPDGTPGFHSPR